MISVQFYNNKSDNRVLNKVITPVTSLTCSLRDDVSIISPVLTLKGVQTLKNANYCYIDDFNRYYYIVDINIVDGETCEITCKCDVLKTYSNDIKNSVGILKRQEKQYNKLLQDNELSMQQNKSVTTMRFSGDFGTAGYVLTVAGNND